MTTQQNLSRLILETEREDTKRMLRVLVRRITAAESGVESAQARLDTLEGQIDNLNIAIDRLLEEFATHPRSILEEELQERQAEHRNVTKSRDQAGETLDGLLSESDALEDDLLQIDRALEVVA